MVEITMSSIRSFNKKQVHNINKTFVSKAVAREGATGACAPPLKKTQETISFVE